MLIKRQALVIRLFVSLFLIVSFGIAQKFRSYSDAYFKVETATTNDSFYLKQVFEILENAKADLTKDWGFELDQGIVVRVHPNLSSYLQQTNMPWYVAAIANTAENKIDTQRLRILIERKSLIKTLRHELFHLAQPDDWPRWRKEGSAMLFAGELAQADIIQDITEDELNYLLANAQTREELQEANATALSWVLSLRKAKSDD